MLIYKLNDGHYITDGDILTAFHVINGSFCVDDPAKYTEFLCSYLDKTFVFTSNVTVNDLLKSNQKVLAVKLYREQNECGLREAHEAVSAMEKEV